MVRADLLRSLLAVLLVWPALAWAQTEPRGPSADGNYWVEVEVTLFSSVYGSTSRSEVPVPSSSLRYLSPLQTLHQQADSYRFPFTADGSDPFAPPTAVAEEVPEFSPAVPTAFKILDHERDAFVALDRRYWRFSQLNSRLQSNGEHAVLWHQVWRQPLRPRGQAPALQVEGGSRFGEHYQLEGSLRLSGQNEQAAVEANLWLSSFTEDRSNVHGDWAVPARPQPDQAGSGNATPLMPTTWYPYDVWHLSQSRDVGPNTLYYLDHPALGLLIEIRPYLVPELKVPTTEAPRQPARTGFE